MSASMRIGGSMQSVDRTGQAKLDPYCIGLEGDAQFRLFADGIPTLAWIAGPDGSITWYNQRWYDYTGTTPEQMKDWGWQAVHDPTILPQAVKIWKRAVSKGEPFEMTCPLRGADGVFRVFLSRAVSVRDEQGRIVGWYGTSTDVSAQISIETALREAEARQKFLLELGDQLRSLSAPLDIVGAAEGALGAYLGANRVGYGEAGNSERYFLVERNWTDGTVDHRIGVHDLAAFGPEIFETIRSGKTLVIHDIAADERIDSPEARAAFASIDTASVITVSLIKNQHFVAALYVHSRNPRTWTDSELTLVEEVAERTWEAVQRARSETALRDNRDRLTAEVAARDLLSATGAALAAELDLDRIVQMVTDAGVELTNAQFGAFFYDAPDEDGEQRTRHTLSGADRAAFEKFGLPQTANIFASTLKNEGIIRSDDITLDPRCEGNAPALGMPGGKPLVRSYLAMPVRSRSGEVLGGLCFGHHQPGIFADRHERLLTGVAAQAAIAMDNARLFRTAQREIEERRRTGDTLRFTERRLNAVLDNATVAIFLMDDQQNCAYMNAAAERLTGYTFAELQGRPLHDAIHHTRPDGSMMAPHDCAITRVYAENCHRQGEEVFIHKDGHFFPVAFTASPIHDEASKTIGTIIEMRDISAEKAAAERQRLLINELNHRVKNTLAIVQGIAQQSFKGDMASFDARTAFEGRLLALSAAHDVLTGENWQDASVAQLIEDAVAPYRNSEERFRISGPHLRIPPKTAVSLSLAMHELSTNAVKYGALSRDEGGVDISWRIDNDRLKLIWRESGGPPVTPPAHQGFGTRMIERGLSGELNGEVKIDFRPDGVVCSIDAPVPGERS